MSTTMRNLTAQQKAVCVLVGCGETQKDAATEVGVDENTVSRWYRDANGLGEAMAHWTAVYADRFAAELLGLALKKARDGMREDDPNAYLWAAEVITKRIGQVEKREHERAKLALDKEKFALESSKNAPPEDDAGAGLILAPPDSEDWKAHLDA